MDGYVSAYWLYKRDTDRCASWLATTALSLGFPRKRFTAAEVDPRKKVSTFTVSSGCSHGGPTDAMPQYRYVLRIPQFIELARYIADKRHAVPPAKLRLIRRCISRRIAYLKAFEDQGQLCDKHVYFVEVLAEVFQILQPCEETDKDEGGNGDNEEHPQQAAGWKKIRAKRGAKKRGRSQHRAKAYSEPRTDSSGDDASSGHLFGRLHLFAESDGERGSSEDEDTDSDAGETLLYRIEDNVDEALCAFMAFYTDLNDVRAFLRQLWSDYRQRKMDLVTASLTTNTAFQLVAKAHNDIVERYRDLFADPSAILEALFDYALDLPAGKDLDDGGEELDDGNSTGCRVKAHEDARTTVEEHFFLLPFRVLSDWRADRLDDDDCHEPSLEGLFDAEAPGFDVALLSHAQRRRLDQDLLYAALNDFATFDDATVRAGDLDALQLLEANDEIPDDLKRSLKQHLQQTKDRIRRVLGPSKALDASGNSPDALTREMSHFLRSTDGPSLLLAFEMQVYLDINHVLQHDNRRGRVEAFTCLHHLELTLNEALRNKCEPNRCKVHHEDQELAIILIRELVQELLKRCHHACTDRSCCHADYLCSPATRQPFLDRHPIFCGLQTFRGLLKLRETGAEVARCSGLALAALHLFTACKGYLTAGQSPLDGFAWPDMEQIVRLRGPEQLFGGSSPPTTARLLRSARMGRRAEVEPQLNRFANDATFVSIFEGISCTCRDHRTAVLQADINNGTVQKLLASSKAKQLRVTQRATVAQSAHSRPAKLPTQHRGRSKSKRSLAIVELLDILAEGLCSDMPGLCFDHIGLNTRCSRVFEAVYAALQKESKVLMREPAFPHCFSPMKAVVETLITLDWWNGRYREMPDVFQSLVDEQREAMERVAAVMRAAAVEVGIDISCLGLWATLTCLGYPMGSKVEEGPSTARDERQDGRETGQNDRGPER
ncbi:uncharacterized protein PFL1_06603 [Pseudozyma flocculosa PF-1]|uniref:DUF6604 domain-containing protein n=1 Tax=Pseudozyma flocculosa PF-1 TaxID=1277687 RepID=A0A061H1E6_9BASI|nr:uncharacterized protein PFL1_06603 [Pseudozyma flocculosa PF-1]EPQ25929.1 hypothetical protein PFL1_06603 [Pseudozyma flocculosa PF-1]